MSDKKYIDFYESQLDSFENVKYRIKNEGLNYTFNGYSDWQEIDDEEFHNLRKEYFNASKKIQEYIDKRIEHYHILLNINLKNKV